MSYGFINDCNNMVCKFRNICYLTQATSDRPFYPIADYTYNKLLNDTVNPITNYNSKASYLQKITRIKNGQVSKVMVFADDQLHEILKSDNASKYKLSPGIQWLYGDDILWKYLLLHPGGANQLFADGHAVTKKGMWYNNVTTYRYLDTWNDNGTPAYLGRGK